MKQRILIWAVIILLASTMCTGLTACNSSDAQVTDAPAVLDEPPESSPSPDEDEIDCRESLTVITREFNNAFYTLDGLLFNPNFEDDDWISEVSLTMSDIMTLCEEAGQLVPPESMAGDHAIYLEAVTYLGDAMDILLKGIDAGDIDLLNGASAEMWLTSEILNNEE